MRKNNSKYRICTILYCIYRHVIPCRLLKLKKGTVIPVPFFRCRKYAHISGGYFIVLPGDLRAVCQILVKRQAELCAEAVHRLYDLSRLVAGNRGRLIVIDGSIAADTARNDMVSRKVKGFVF